MSDLLVSVILPNYNHNNYLQQRWESIVNQTYQNFEIILLDDASTDQSASLIAQYAANPKVLHSVINTENSGSPFAQWQRGIDLAKGKFIWIAESDDYCESSFLETLVALITDKTVLAYVGSTNVDQEGNLLGLNENPDPLNRKRWYSDYRNSGANEIKRYLRFKNTIPNASAVLFRKAAVRSEFFKTDYNYCGDWYFWLQLLKHGDIAYSAKRLNFFRFHQDSSRAVKDETKDIAMFTEFFELIYMESTSLDRLRFRKRFYWIPEALNRFEQDHGAGKIYNDLARPYQKLLSSWKRLESLFG